MSQIEHYCFEEHEEIRRAAVECLCNMVVDEEVRSCIQQTVKLLHDILLLGRHLFIKDTVGHHTHIHTHTAVYGLWSGTTWVGRYQKKHSPTHTHPDHRTFFIIFLHLQRSMASTLFILRV